MRSIGISGSHPVALVSLVWSPRSTGMSTGREQLRVRLEAHRPGGQRQQLVGQFLHREVGAGAHVVDLARLAGLDEQPVGPHHVTHVGEVAAGRQVADGEDVAALQLVAGDPRRQGRCHELVGLTGTEVVERPNPQHGQPAPEPGLQPEVVGGDLAGRVRAGRAQRRVLGEREALGW